MNRRTFLQGTLATLAALPAHAQEVPNSTGTERPKTKAPAHACDCHMHIFDPEHFPMSLNPDAAPKRASIPQYRLLQRRMGTSRTVIVTPRNYRVDNSATLNAIKELKDARGVAVVDTSVTDAELKKLNDGGIRGIRFSLTDPATAVVSNDMIEPLARRVADYGWHFQMNMQGKLIVEMADVLRKLPVPIVFDHMGQPPMPAGVASPSHRIVRELLDKGRTWVKLSGAHITGKPPKYAETAPIAEDLIQAAPERLVWGSDWPHPSLPENDKPDDAVLFDLLATWAPKEATRRRILVENPEKLYGFAKSS
jgi:D-galactarolactone isomerase